jgi:hypothetical protein
MKEFEPSRDFVARVMQDVHAYEGAKIAIEPLGQRLLASRAFRLVFSSGAALLGVLNLVRLYFTVLSPVVCR